MPPVRFLVLLVLLSLILWGLALAIVRTEPWLGLDRATAAEAVELTAARQLLGLKSQGLPEFALEAGDFIEEPDLIDDYARMQRFFDRQSALHARLSGAVSLRWRDGSRQVLQQVRPDRRPLQTLPASFWLQLAYGSFAAWLGSWVWSLRPREHATRLLAVTGVSFFLITWSAAIYSSRGLALDGRMFQALSTLNHLGVALFGSALIALMMSYPRLRFPSRWLWLPFAFFGAWFMLDVLRLAADQNWGSRIPCLLQMLLAIGLGCWQWRCARDDALDRAALSWVLISTLVGCGLFVFLVTASAVFGLQQLLPQSQAFAFFLIMYAGLALGVWRYRLFRLDRYAYRVLLWTLGAMMVFGMDALLVTFFGIAPESALAVSFLASGWIYFPLRQWLWMRLMAPEPSLRELLEEVTAISLLPDDRSRATSWRALLSRLFQPARLSESRDHTLGKSALVDDGLALLVPQVEKDGALRLELKSEGRRLFRKEDAQLADSLSSLLQRLLLQQADIAAATQRERQRLADDLHDDLGSRLLVLIHRAGDSAVADIARAAIADLRSLVAALDGPACNLQEALANCRAEASERCEVARVPLRWRQDHDLPEHLLGSRARSLLERAVREMFTNALKHGDGRGIECGISLAGQSVRILVSNRRISGMARGASGRGLSSLRRRLEELGGNLTLSYPDSETVIAKMEFPACEVS